ncbi:MAG TPA: hypothetical protein VGD94_12340 [Vicinamibacterales bacterium]
MSHDRPPTLDGADYFFPDEEERARATIERFRELGGDEAALRHWLRAKVSTLPLERDSQSVVDRRALAKERRDAAARRGSGERFLHLQIPAYRPIGPPRLSKASRESIDAAFEEARERQRARPKEKEGAALERQRRALAWPRFKAAGDAVTGDQQLRRIRSHLMPSVIRVVVRFVSPLENEIRKRERSRLRRELRADPSRKVLNDAVGVVVNALAADLVRALFPLWGAVVGPADIREIKKNRRRVATR